MKGEEIMSHRVAQCKHCGKVLQVKFYVREECPVMRCGNCGQMVNIPDDGTLTIWNERRL